MATISDHFEGEDVIITFEEEDSEAVTNVEGKIINIDIGGGNTPTEDVFLFGNKTINFQKPREKYTIAFDYITSTTTFAQVQFGGTGGVGNELRSSSTAKRWRIMLWFQAYSSHVTSGTVVVPDKGVPTRRMIFCDCKAIENKVTFAADDMLRGTINFEFSAVDSNGYANYFDEYTNGTTTALHVMSVIGTAPRYKGALTWNHTTPAWTGAYRST